LPISFKGNRDYLYASDIFTLIVKTLVQNDFDEIINIDFSVYKLSNKGIEFILYKEDIPTLDKNYIAQIKFESEEVSYFGIVKSIDSDVLDRTEYNEDQVVANSVLDKKNNSIALNEQYQEYSNLDVFTSMNKRLLYELRPDIEGKWLSVRLQLESLKKFQQRDVFSIQLVKIFSNKYAKSSLFNKGEKLGNLFFSLKK